MQEFFSNFRIFFLTMAQNHPRSMLFCRNLDISRFADGKKQPAEDRRRKSVGIPDLPNRITEQKPIGQRRTDKRHKGRQSKQKSLASPILRKCQTKQHSRQDYQHSRFAQQGNPIGQLPPCKPSSNRINKQSDRVHRTLRPYQNCCRQQRRRIDRYDSPVHLRQTRRYADRKA